MQFGKEIGDLKNAYPPLCHTDRADKVVEGRWALEKDVNDSVAHAGLSTKPGIILKCPEVKIGSSRGLPLT